MSGCRRAAVAEQGKPPAALHHRVEVVGLRTAHSRTYVEDGHYTTQIFADDVNYRDAADSWQSIDNALVPGPNGTTVNKANGYQVQFPATIGASPVHVALGANWVDLSLEGVDGPGTISGSTDSYAIAGGSVAFTALNDSLKEAVTLD